MYEGGMKSGSRKIIIIVCVIFAVVLIGVFAKVIIDKMNGDKGAACKNREGMSALEKAGVWGEDSEEYCDEEE